MTARSRQTGRSLVGMMTESDEKSGRDIGKSEGMARGSDQNPSRADLGSPEGWARRGDADRDAAVLIKSIIRPH